VPSGPDPLGKRALYWMPVDRLAVEDPSEGAPSGMPGDAGPQRGPTRQHARPAGKHALYSGATPAEEASPATSSVTATDPLPPRGLFTVGCSACGSVSRVGPVGLLFLHVPLGAWLPGRKYDRWMTCPACRRRTWTSVSLSR